VYRGIFFCGLRGKIWYDFLWGGDEMVLTAWMGLLVILFGYVLAWPLSYVSGRVPRVLMDRWAAECRDYLAVSGDGSGVLGFLGSGLRCDCKRRASLALVNTLPVIGFLRSRGRCSVCEGGLIPRFYLVLEILCPILMFLTANHFGLGVMGFICMGFTWVLLALTGMDCHSQLLPDCWTISLLWLGLLFSMTSYAWVTLDWAVWGAILAYMIPWLIAKFYVLFSGKEGMGYGDCKMLAMLGAWFGPHGVLAILFAASLLSVFYSILARVIWAEPIFGHPRPFGPALAAAAWVHLLYGSWVEFFLFGSRIVF
jgi:leader peptidase (prepilin peptidase) / N-methyltransferase